MRTAGSAAEVGDDLSVSLWLTAPLKGEPLGFHQKGYTMNKLWAGRSEAETSALADAFNSSIAVDGRMYQQDITGSMAHAAMLAKCGILTQADADQIIGGLAGILADLQSGALQLDLQAEDIHMFVEAELTSRIGGVILSDIFGKCKCFFKILKK